MGSKKQCQSCNRGFSVFIRPYSCELCNQSKLCSNCARKFVLSYEPNPAYLRLCNGCCDKVSRGNRLKHPSSKSSKTKGKNNSVWSWIGKSSSKKQYASKQSQSIDLSSYSPPTSCTYCCSTQNKLINKKIAVYTNELKDQAPLFPENYNLSTPQRQQNVISRQRLSDEENDNVDAINIESDDDDCDQYLYRTMHPLNNLKLKPPKSILSVSQNQVALNISINREETRHCVGNLEKTSLCDCYSSMLNKKQNLQITSNDDASENNPVNNDNIDRFHRCVTVPIKHKTFKLLRMDLLFDDSEYNELIGDTNEKYAAINVSLYDHQSQMYSGVQMIKIHDIAPYRIISQISVQCNQTMLKKSVNVMGSMSWRICNDSHNDDAPLSSYPYKTCNVSEMISILTQQRFDIIDSYDTVIQQRKSVNSNIEKQGGKKSVNPQQKYQDDASLEQDEDSSSAKDEDSIRLYPIKDIPQEDGGSKIPTKRSELLPHKEIRSLNLDDSDNHNQEGIALLYDTFSPKQPGVRFQEMERNMLQHEIARIDSMILGLETVMSCINESNRSRSTMNNHQFDELTSSVTSSYMFNTNELNEVKVKMADRLSQDMNKIDASSQLIAEMTKAKVVDTNITNTIVNTSTLPKMFPICLCCQRCSRTIIIRETTQ